MQIQIQCIQLHIIQIYIHYVEKPKVKTSQYDFYKTLIDHKSTTSTKTYFLHT